MQSPHKRGILGSNPNRTNFGEFNVGSVGSIPTARAILRVLVRAAEGASLQSWRDVSPIAGANPAVPSMPP